jgi:hypothetical protein
MTDMCNGMNNDIRGNRRKNTDELIKTKLPSAILHHHVQNGSGAHPASYPTGTRGSFRGDKAAGA